MKSKKWMAALLAAVVCAAMLVGCSNQPAGSQAGSGSSMVLDSGASQQLPEEGGELKSEFVGPSLGEFSTQGVDGNTYTQEIFQDYELTMVNVFTTWCSPCVAEMPDLEKLHQQVADRNVNVIGVVLDVLDEKGNVVPENLERAQELVEKTGVTYPVLLPDSTYFNGRLTGIEAFPESFFVDQNGDVVGGTYSGSGGLEDWLQVVEEELANVQGAK